MRVMSRIFETETIFELQKIKGIFEDEDMLKTIQCFPFNEVGMGPRSKSKHLKFTKETMNIIASTIFNYELIIHNFIGENIRNNLKEKKKLDGDIEKSKTDDEKFFKYFKKEFHQSYIKNEINNEFVKKYIEYFNFYLIIHYIFEALFCVESCQKEALGFLKNIIVEKDKKSLTDLLKHMILNSSFVLDDFLIKILKKIVKLLKKKI